MYKLYHKVDDKVFDDKVFKKSKYNLVAYLGCDIGNLNNVYEYTVHGKKFNVWDDLENFRHASIMPLKKGNRSTTIGDVIDIDGVKYLITITSFKKLK